MDNFAADFTINNDDSLAVEYTLEPSETFDCSFEIYASGTVWGNIAGEISNQTDLSNILTDLDGRITVNADNILALGTSKQDVLTAGSGIDITDNVISCTVNSAQWGNITGTLADQTDLQNALNAKQDVISDLSDIRTDATNGATAYSTIQTYGDIVTYNAANFATSAQGSLADTALQPNDNISELVNDAGYITAASLPTVNNGKMTFSVNSDEAGEFYANQSTNTTININVPTDTSDLTNGAGFITASALPTVNDGKLTLQVNSVDIGEFTANQSSTSTINITVPTDTADLTNGAGFLTNNATGVNALAVGNTSQSTAEGGVAIGYGAQANSTYSTAIGQNTRATNTNTTVIGRSAKATQARAIAIGSGAEANAQDAIAIKGINNTANTFQVYTYNMLDMATGLIPDARISTNIARTSAIPTVNDATLTIQKNGTDIETFTANASSNVTCNITVPTAVTDLSDASNYVLSSSLATVATSGDYDDLINKPTIPAAQVQADWDEANPSSMAYIQNKPTIPSGVIVDQVYDATSTNAQSGVAIAGAGFLTGISSTDVTNALGYTPYSSANPSNYQENVIESIEVNGTAQTISSKTVNITVPTDTLDLTNGAGYITGITSTDVTNALGYTPYSDANPNGYTSNIGTVTSVNNVSPVSGNVTISIPTDTNDLTNGAGYITSSALTDYVTTNTAQTISARKTFTGEKAIYFKQTTNSDKLGFTLYNSGGTELGAFEYRPNTISGNALIAINTSYANSAYVGFRYWGTAVNIVAPKPSAGDYFIPINITDGNTTVTAGSTGSVNISSLLPTIPTVDQTYDDTSANAQSGVAIAGAGFLTSGDLKTINNTSIVGVGDIDTSEVFVAEYGVTTYQEVSDALTAGKQVFCKRIITSTQSAYYSLVYAWDNINYTFAYNDGNTNYELNLLTDDSWSDSSTASLYTNLSNLSATGQKVIDGQWVYSSSTLANGVTSPTSTDLSYNLATYLPDDTYDYEVLFSMNGATSGTSGSYSRGILYTDLTTSSNVCYVYYVRTTAAINTRGAGNAILAVGSGRKVYVAHASDNSGTFSLTAIGYRRIGTNS